ncbi:MAG: RNA methyltransferase [Sphingobacteriales bacterium]|jgi:23S rRNA (guanosine2251-2'-O)-methyltransferase|nr:RNA methyltransferase [Sphingobacteriales bacterium]
MRKLTMSELNRLSVDEFKDADKVPIVMVLDNVRSLHNVGSVFRTADAFRVTALYLCGITATPPNKEIYKTALGSTESVEWHYFSTTNEALLHLKHNNYTLVAVEQTSNSLSLTQFTPQETQKYALVLGNEVYGVAEDALPLCDIALEIPQLGTKHSLNVSVCAGIVLWDFLCKAKLL